MAIIWRKGMSVCNDVIDHDHQFMVNFVNTIELALQTPEEKEIILEAFEQLYDYSVGHFRREESIQRKIEYPKSLPHKNSHASLLTQLESLKKDLEKIETPEKITNKAPQVVKFLRDWLMNHVLDEDLLLKPYLEKYPKGFS